MSYNAWVYNVTLLSGSDLKGVQKSTIQPYGHPSLIKIALMQMLLFI